MSRLTQNKARTAAMGMCTKEEQQRFCELLLVPQVSGSINVIAPTPKKGQKVRQAVHMADRPIRMRPLREGHAFPPKRRVEETGEGDDEVVDASLLSRETALQVIEQQQEEAEEKQLKAELALEEAKRDSGIEIQCVEDGFNQKLLSLILDLETSSFQQSNLTCFWKLNDPWSECENLLDIDVEGEMGAFWAGQKGDEPEWPESLAVQAKVAGAEEAVMAKEEQEGEEDEELLAIDVAGEIDAFWATRRGGEPLDDIEAESEEILMAIDVVGEIQAHWASRKGGEPQDDEGAVVVVEEAEDDADEEEWLQAGLDNWSAMFEAQEEETRAFKEAEALFMGDVIKGSDVDDASIVEIDNDSFGGAEVEERDLLDVASSSGRRIMTLQEELDATASGGMPEEGCDVTLTIPRKYSLRRREQDVDSDDESLDGESESVCGSEDEFNFVVGSAGAVLGGADEEDNGNVALAITAESVDSKEECGTTDENTEYLMPFGQRSPLKPISELEDGANEGEDEDDYDEEAINLMRMIKQTEQRRQDAIAEVERRRQLGPSGLTGSASGSTRDFQQAYFASLRAAKSYGSMQDIA